MKERQSIEWRNEWMNEFLRRSSSRTSNHWVLWKRSLSLLRIYQTPLSKDRTSIDGTEPLWLNHLLKILHRNHHSGGLNPCFQHYKATTLTNQLSCLSSLEIARNKARPQTKHFSLESLTTSSLCKHKINHQPNKWMNKGQKNKRKHRFKPGSNSIREKQFAGGKSGYYIVTICILISPKIKLHMSTVWLTCGSHRPGLVFCLQVPKVRNSVSNSERNI